MNDIHEPTVKFLRSHGHDRLADDLLKVLEFEDRRVAHYQALAREAMESVSA